jgi:hypothetical protein
MRSISALLFAAMLIVTGASAPERRILAWINGGDSKEAAKQYTNASWDGLFTGVMGFCGGDFAVASNGSASVIVNETSFAECAAIQKAVASRKGEFHLCLGTVPPEAVASPAGVIASAVALAKKHGLSGFNIDDESHTAPRGDIPSFIKWVGFIDAFADGLHAHNLQLTADVQSVTLPWKYKPVAQLSQLLSESHIDRWINMDTCK